MGLSETFGVSEAVGTALFIVLLVFTVLVCLWILLRIMSAVVRKFESLIRPSQNEAPPANTQNH